MEAQVQKRPVLITLTAPSAGGKSYLFNYIRDVAKLPCLISTTTRAARAGEREGIDYFYISEEESKRLEEANQFAELAVYGGTRYGVTKKEFQDKMSKGMAFLIVEPTGIDHYVRPASEIGALHYKTYVHTDPQIRMKRFRERVEADMLRTLGNAFLQKGTIFNHEMVLKEVRTALNRQQQMLTEEMQWATMHNWDRILFGDAKPEENLKIILDDVQKLQDHQLEIDTEYRRKQSISDEEMAKMSDLYSGRWS